MSHRHQGRPLAWALAAVLACVATACGSSTAVGADRDERESGVVEKLVDGDTLWIRLGNVTEKTRLVLVDTPETVHPFVADECFGHKASNALSKIIPVGTDVLVERAEEERDRYGRLLAYVWRERDDVLVNELMLLRGFATVLVIAPNTDRLDEFREAEAKAKDDERGLWSTCAIGDS